MEDFIPYKEIELDVESKRRSESADRVVTFLQRTHTYEYVRKIMNRDIEPDDFSDFKDFLVRLNGIIREIPTDKRSTDGKDVVVADIGYVNVHYFPKQEDKEELLEYAYKSILNVRVGDEKYMLPAIVNAIHLFNDGNGRVSRILYQLLVGYWSEQKCLDNIRDALNKDGRFDTPNINPGFIDKEIEDIVLEKWGWKSGVRDYIGEITGGFATAGTNSIEGVDPGHLLFASMKEFSECANRDVLYAASAIHHVLSPEEVDSILIGGLRPISFKKMAEVLNKEQWHMLIDVYWRIKREYVKTIVDMFISPDTYKIKKLDGESVNLKDLFIDKIKKAGEM